MLPVGYPVIFTLPACAELIDAQGLVRERLPAWADVSAKPLTPLSSA
jgi:hypothetical protein